VGDVVWRDGFVLLPSRLQPHRADRRPLEPLQPGDAERLLRALKLEARRLTAGGSQLPAAGAMAAMRSLTRRLATVGARPPAFLSLTIIRSHRIPSAMERVRAWARWSVKVLGGRRVRMGEAMRAVAALLGSGGGSFGSGGAKKSFARKVR